MSPHILRKSFLVLGLAVCLIPPCGTQDLKPGIIGIYTIPRDLEMGLEILPKGEYEFDLVVSDRRSSIGFGTIKPDETGGTRGWSDAAIVTEVKENYPKPKVEIGVVTEGGEEFVEIRVYYENKLYRNLWKCATDPISPSEREKESGPIDPAIEMEVKLLAEAGQLMNAFAGRIWPGWDGYKALDFTLRFPNQDYIVVTRKERLPRRFKILPGGAMEGKEVYIDRSKELPGRIDPGMSINGHGDYAGVSAGLISRMISSTSPVEEPKPADPDLEKLNVAMRLSRTLIYIHEAFHSLQANLQRAAQKGGYFKPVKMADYDAQSEYSVYADVEGQALLRAFGEKDPAKALADFKDAFAARKLKQASIPPEAAAMEKNRTASEGTSTYSELKTAALMMETGYPGAGATKDPEIAAALRTADEYFEKNGLTRLKEMASRTLDVNQRFYLYGGFYCFLLDRFLPDWKKDFFEKYRTLDEVIDGFLKLSPEDSTRISQSWEAKYDMKGLREKHGSVIKDRDDAVRSVTDRKGRKFAIDIRRAQRGIDIRPRGLDHVIAYKGDQYFPHGLTKFVYGSLNLESQDTPMRMSFSARALEWIDVETKAGEKGYDLKFGGQEGDLYKDVTLTTKGFTMTAKAVKIVEDADKVTISIIDF